MSLNSYLLDYPRLFNNFTSNQKIIKSHSHTSKSNKLSNGVPFQNKEKLDLLTAKETSQIWQQSFNL
jgi:hypothetical protein